MVALSYRACQGLWSVRTLIGGSLSGAVSICAGADAVDPWAAVIIGGIGGALYFHSAHLMVRLGIDDPIEAVPVHLSGGLWGLLARGIFANRAALPDGSPAVKGILAAGFSPESLDFFGWQILGALVISMYSGSFAAVVCMFLNNRGWLRVTPEEEKLGLDILFHGVEAHMKTLDDLEGFRKITRRQRNSMVSESSLGSDRPTKDTSVPRKPGEKKRDSKKRDKKRDSKKETRKRSDASTVVDRFLSAVSLVC